jgi:probable phosphomutase (TIGR03848 family)
VPTTPKPTTVLLVRHGRTPTTGAVLPGRSPGLHLADEGRQQAERVAERIGALRHRPSAVYASPLERTKETAAPIARAVGVRVRTKPGLIECDMGRWTGGQLKRLARTNDWRTVQRWPGGFRFPDGESFAEMSTRATAAVLELVAAHPGETIVAVSHADPIKAVVATAAGVPLDLFQRLVVSPCSVTAIVYGADGPHVLCLNAVDSLTSLELS